MPRFKREPAGADGWTRWVRPTPQGYGFQCCDCGLVHRLDFRVVREYPEDAPDTRIMEPDFYHVEFRAKRMRKRKAIAKE